MQQDHVKRPFSITYRLHWCGPCRKYEDTKEETTIADDGEVTARRYDRRGAKGSYRVIERAAAHISPDDAEKLYTQLMGLLYNHEGIADASDVIEEVLLVEPGLRIKIDGGLFNEGVFAGQLVELLLSSIEIEWEAVTH